MRTPLLFGLLGILLLGAGCKTDPPAPPLEARTEQEPDEPLTPQAGSAVLEATGGLKFRGGSRLRCVLHDERGLQVNFRTGDSDLPAVALRIEELRGAGDYPGRLFVTGRGESGALAGAIGAAEVELKQVTASAGSNAMILSGSFKGSYGGEAGRGSLEGRFEACAYSPERGGPPRLAAQSSAKAK